MSYEYYLFNLLVLLIPIGLFTYRTVKYHYGLCPRCGAHQVKTTVTYLGSSKENPEIEEYVVIKMCKECSWYTSERTKSE